MSNRIIGFVISLAITLDVILLMTLLLITVVISIVTSIKRGCANLILNFYAEEPTSELERV